MCVCVHGMHDRDWGKETEREGTGCGWRERCCCQGTNIWEEIVTRNREKWGDREMELMMPVLMHFD